MGNSFIRALLSTAKAKITPIVTKLRFFLTPQFWRTKVLTKFRELFSKIFDIKPKDKDDYYSIWRYLVSKRLAYAIVLTIGVLSAVYIVAIRGMLVPSTDGIKTYKYTSVMLRFTTNDKVIITGKSGYKAYEGAVNKGRVTGTGQLYDKHGHIVYQGDFQNNRYNGVGTSYYENGAVKYNGEFTENLYEGTGKLYRDSGSVYYNGEFSQGLKNGTGTLYNSGGNAVYTGGFSKDELSYHELIGKTATEVNECYTGEWTVYESSDSYCVSLPDIKAIYAGGVSEDSVDDDVVVHTVYVLKDSFKAGKEEFKSIKEVKEYFGEPIYHGNSLALMPEAVAINEMKGSSDTFSKDIGLKYVREYDEYCNVGSYDDEYVLYLYSFERNGMLYTFFCNDKDSGFGFYSIMAYEGDDDLEEEDKE